MIARIALSKVISNLLKRHTRLAFYWISQWPVKYLSIETSHKGLHLIHYWFRDTLNVLYRNGELEMYDLIAKVPWLLSVIQMDGVGSVITV